MGDALKVWMFSHAPPSTFADAVAFCEQRRGLFIHGVSWLESRSCPQNKRCVSGRDLQRTEVQDVCDSDWDSRYSDGEGGSKVSQSSPEYRPSQAQSPILQQQTLNIQHREGVRAGSAASLHQPCFSPASGFHCSP